MSSHHIIRDEQEPALILANLEAFPFDLLGQLLEWAPYTICGEAALEQALNYGINLDVVISNRENVMKSLEHFPGVKLISAEEDWLMQAVRYLSDKGHKAVNVIMEDSLANVDLLNQVHSQMLVDVITPKMKYIRVENKINKWMPTGSQLTLIGENPFHVNGVTLIANKITVEQDGFVAISSEHPFILGQLF